MPVIDRLDYIIVNRSLRHTYVSYVHDHTNQHSIFHAIYFDRIILITLSKLTKESMIINV